MIFFPAVGGEIVTDGEKVALSTTLAGIDPAVKETEDTLVVISHGRLRSNFSTPSQEATSITLDTDEY